MSDHDAPADCLASLCDHHPLQESLIIASDNQELLRLSEVSELDQDEVHDLLHGVDHEEPGQDQDLRHRKPGVWERALCDRRGGDLNMIFF